MAAVFELYRRDGTTVFNGSTIVVKYVGRRRIQPNETGNLTDARFTANGAQPWWGFEMLDSNTSYTPVVYSSGNTIYWNPSPAPVAYEGSRIAVDLIYGYF